MKLIKYIVLLLLFCLQAQSAEYYRSNPPPYRWLGTDQGNVGSCQAEADIAAIESVFWHLGHTVQLSTFYRHAFNWQNETEHKLKNDEYSLRLTYSPEDKALLQKLGGIVPHYFLPDDTAAYLPNETGNRVSLSKMIVVDPTYKPFNVQQSSLTFFPGYSNSISIQAVKSLVQSNVAVSLAINASILSGQNFNEVTGLLKRDTSLDSYAKEDATHAVAVIGYDDSLYSDYGYQTPGALIIKNSWNNMSRIKLTQMTKVKDYETESALHRMKYKISPREILPGYYAIPYELIKKIVANKKEVYVRRYDLDYSAFSNQYNLLMPKYKVVAAPFNCRMPSKYVESTKNLTKELIIKFGRVLKQALFKQAQGQNTKLESDWLFGIIHKQTDPYALDNFDESKFSYALLTQNKELNIDRVKDFYEGKFNDYYCSGFPAEIYNTQTYIYPNIEHYSNRQFQNVLDELTADTHSIAGWWNFMQTLYNLEENDDLTTIPIH